MTKIAQLAIRRRWWIVATWIVAIIAIQGLASAMGGAKYKDDFKLPNTETETVGNLLNNAGLNQQNNASGTVVLHAKSGSLSSAPSSLAPALQALCKDGNAKVGSITTPWSTVSCSTKPGGSNSTAKPELLSSNKQTGIVTVNWSVENPNTDTINAVYKDLKALRSDSLQVEFTGEFFTGVESGNSGGNTPQLVGFLAAAIILFFVFRTFGATVLPLISAVAALTSGGGLIAILTHGMSVASFAPYLADLMVIGVGVDYALFIVTRHRRNLTSGMGVQESIVNAINTSGRAVLFAGTTVCIALLGLCALGVSFLYGVAIGVAIAVALTMVASLTLLPAMLSFLGLKVLPRRQRKAVRAGNFEEAHTHGFWYRWAGLVQRRSLLTGGAALIVLVLLALPFFSLRLGHADQSNDPKGTTTRRGYDLIQQDFGKGYNSTLQLVVSGPQAADKAYLQKVTSALAQVPDVNKSSIATVPLTKDVSMVSFKSISGPQDEATDKLVKVLRNKTLPQLYNGTSNHVYVYGMTAIFIDFTKVLSAKMLLFFVAVIGLSFILLMIAFRSIVIPLTAAAMNLLASGAAFGLLVAIFQWGWFGDTIGVGKGGPIEAFFPVIFFAVLFGLSMDYQVFLVSRMHEEWIHRRDNRQAVTVGQGETGGIITAAGLIMITVFASFILTPDRVSKMLGIGFAGAIFLDAFIVRTFVVPSIMHWLGKANWYYPKWLDKITPQVSIEPPEVAAETESPAQPDDDPRLARV